MYITLGIVLLEILFLLETVTLTGVSGQADVVEAENMFTEQPHNTEVIEPGVATFQCKLADPALSIFWFVNGSHAGYTKFQQRGVSIETIVPYSESVLHIEGHMENNNTLVFCGVLLEVPELMWINSRIASMLVMENSSVSQFSSVSQDSKSTSTLHTEPSPTATPGKSAENTVTISSVIVAISLLTLTFLASLALISIIGIVWKKGKKRHPPDGKDTIHVNPNPVYEYTKAPKCRGNPAYNVVVPLLQQ